VDCPRLAQVLLRNTAQLAWIKLADWIFRRRQCTRLLLTRVFPITILEAI